MLFQQFRMDTSLKFCHTFRCPIFDFTLYYCRAFQLAYEPTGFFRILFPEVQLVINPLKSALS